MPCWFYEQDDLKNTPSRKDGIDEGTEGRYRREGARFLIEAGTVMKLRYDTMATGVVYFHRFYMFHSFKEFPRYLTGAACLFLAGKVEETPKKCKDIIRISKDILPEHHFAAFGDDPKEEIMTYERILLQTIKFDLQVEHPYSYLLKYAKTFKGDKEKIQKLVQMAWTFVNDSLCTTLCLQWEPHITAVAFLYLAGRLSKSDLLDWSGKSTKVKWWESLSEDVSLDIMEDVCHHLLDLYAAGKKGAQGSQAKGGKRSKQKSPSMTDTDKPKDEPKSKLAKVETAKSTPPPPPPPSVKVKASTSSKPVAAAAAAAVVPQHVKPATTTQPYSEVTAPAAVLSKPSTSSTNPQAVTPAATVPGSYSATLPQQSYTVAPPVFTGTLTPPKYPSSTQAGQFYPTEQVPLPVIPPAAPTLLNQSQYPTTPVPVAPTAQFQQPPYGNQYLSSTTRQDYSVPPPIIPAVTNPTPVSTQGAGTSSSMYTDAAGLGSSTGLHSGLHTGVGLLGTGGTTGLEHGVGSIPGLGLTGDMTGPTRTPTRPSLQPPLVQGMSQRTAPPPMPMLPRPQRPLTPSRQMMKTLPSAPIPPATMTSLGSLAVDNPTGFQGRNPRSFSNYSTPPPLMSLPMNRPPKGPRVPGRSLLPPKGSMAPGPGMWNSQP